MPTTLTIAQHLDALERSGAELVEHAVAAGLDTPVPTCPTWDAADLLVHQTMVHRWATAHVRREDPEQVPDHATIRSTVDDLPAHYREGLRGLVAALRAASDDLRALVFLNDAPAPRAFWVRRQAHETTVHMVDALAALQHRPPAADDTGIGTALALDGLDELLCGFFTRGKCRLFTGDPYTVAVVPADSDRRWRLHVDERMTTEELAPGRAIGAAAATLRGTAVELYLGLWNRGEVQLEGRPDVLEAWRANHRVRWT